MIVPEWIQNAMGQTIMLRTGPGELHAQGRLIAYQDRPTVLIEQGDGTRVSWLATLAEPLRHDALCCPVAYDHPPSAPGCSSSPLLWEGDQA